MSAVPRAPKIYHITHVRNLRSIAATGHLVSDQRIAESEVSHVSVGMAHIKERRQRKSLPCHEGTSVGDYVPFYFCPRSIMLFLLYKGNHPDLVYREGQGAIVHLQADLRKTIAWATSEKRRWAFTDGNAGSRLTAFFDSEDDMDKLDWDAIASTSWSEVDIKEKKQAEFLMWHTFPFELIEAIGASSERAIQDVTRILGSTGHMPRCSVQSSWYY
jgi:hypothetical protein